MSKIYNFLFPLEMRKGSLHMEIPFVTPLSPPAYSNPLRFLFFSQSEKDTELVPLSIMNYSLKTNFYIQTNIIGTNTEEKTFLDGNLQIQK